MASKDDAKKAKQTAQDLRKTAQFTKFGKALFTGKLNNLSPAQITQLLRLMGVKIPKEVEITIAGAQLIAAGGATIDAINQAEDIRSIATPGGQTIRGVMEVSKLMGWLDADSEQVEMMTIGIDIAMVIAGGGANVKADIQLALDLAMMSMKHQAKTEGRAIQGAHEYLSATLKGWFKPQEDAAVKNFKDLAEGKLSMFQFIGEIAYQSPGFFPNFFPELSAFIPPVATKFWAEYTASEGYDTPWGPVNTAYSKYYAERIVQVTRVTDWKNFADTMLNVYIEPVLNTYSQIAQLTQEELKALDPKLDHPNPVQRIDINTLCVMSQISPGFNNVPEGFDVVAYLNYFGLTPYDFTLFRDDCIMNELNNPQSDFFMTKEEKRIESPVSYNGVDYVPKTILNQNQREKMRAQYRLDILAANERGDIKFLLKDPVIVKLIREWGRIVARPEGVSFTYGWRTNGKSKTWGLVPVKSTALSQQIQITDKSLLSNASQVRNALVTGGSWRNMQNYFGAMSFLETFKDDPFFKALSYDKLYSYSWVQNSYYINALFQDTMRKITFKRMNEIALKNVASFLGTTPNNIRRVNGYATEQPAVYERIS